MDFTKNMAGDGRAFTTKMKTEIGDSGIQDIWEDYINSNWGIMEAEQEAGITRRMGKSRKTMHLPVNEWGEPIVPDVDLVAESGEVPAEFSGLRDYFQTMLRTFLSMHWGLAGPVTAKDPTVPWSDIIKILGSIFVLNICLTIWSDCSKILPRCRWPIVWIF